LDALLEGARSSRSGVLVVRGEAGIGKSALLDDAVARARGMPVLRAIGVESEAEMAFAGLHQLVRPVLGAIDRLPERQADALACAFGLGGGAVDDRFLVSLATLGLLSDTADDDGLLCAIDDAQWLDEPSAGALLFVARRLEAEGVVMLIGVREGGARRFEAPGLPELALTGLPTDAAATLLADRTGPSLAPAVRDRLLALSVGNPLALIELPGALSAEQLSGREPLLEPLPVGERVEGAFLARIRHLEPDAQALLLLAAADDMGDLAAVLRAATELGIDRRALDGLETAALVHVDGTAITFHHPLVRSAVYRSATFTQREKAHGALARALPDEADADRRAWHLSAATPGPDATVADELERSAIRARGRAGHAAAAAALERAAHLSVDDQSRGRRLLACAESNWLGGRADRVEPLLDQSEPLLSVPELRARAALLRGSHELDRGVPDRAYEVLVEGARSAAEVDPPAALEMLVRAAEACWFSGRTEWAAELGALAAVVPVGAHDAGRFMVALLQGTGSVLHGDYERAVPLLEQALTIAAGFERPRHLISAAAAAIDLGDIAGAHSRYARATAQLRRAGAVGDLILPLQLLATVEILLGRYASAIANAAEGLRLAVETGQETNTSYQLATLAFAEAWQGREADCRAHAAEAMELAVRRGLALQGAVAVYALGVLELGLRRMPEAVDHMAAIADPGSGLAHPLVALYSAPDLVEAAVRAGQPEVGEAALARFSAWAEHVPTRWPTAVAARSRGLLIDSKAADEHFEAALEHHADAEVPFQQARTQLLYGEHLRRALLRRDARPHLRAAAATFEAVGANPWADRARAELRATGETARRRDPSTIDQLTAQELQIARFVSEGATNREVAGKLFLSPKTVEYHLHKVFTKLGIGSRAELARLLPDPEHEVAAA
jgi:DNA-binding CsgD family transcriptional regulator